MENDKMREVENEQQRFNAFFPRIIVTQNGKYNGKLEV